MHRHKVETVRMLIGEGNARAKRGDYQGAKTALEAAIAFNPHFDGAYTHLADVCQKLQQQDKARQVLEHCHRHVNPSNGEVAFSLGALYLREQDYDNAKSCMEACLEVDPWDTDAMSVLAQAAAAQGNRGEEESWYRRMVDTPGIDKETAASAYCNLGVLKEGQPEEIGLYEKALELLPANFQPRYSLGSAHAGQKDWKQAAESFRMAVSLATLDENLEGKSQALASLYRVALLLIQSERQNGSALQNQEMMERLYNVMGKENYERLAASRR